MNRKIRTSVAGWLAVLSGVGALALLLGGCATMPEKRLRLTVATEPPGASCALAFEGQPTVYSIAATPGAVDVGDIAKPLTVRCGMPGHLEVDERYEHLGLVASGLAESGSHVASTTSVSVGIPATPAPTTAQSFLFASATMGPVGLILLPFAIVAVLVTTPSDASIDATRGFIDGNPPAIVLQLPPSTFSDVASRDAYFRVIEDRIDRAGAEARRQIDAECKANCAWHRATIEVGVAARRQKIDALRERTRIAGTTAPTGAPAP
jgi:hypothetical protein